MTTPMNLLLVLSDSALSFYNVTADITSIEQHPTTIKYAPILFIEISFNLSYFQRSKYVLHHR
jgi:hypothetical protein